MPREETVRSFGEVLAAKYDDLAEQAFYRVGGIGEVVEIARSLQGRAPHYRRNRL